MQKDPVVQDNRIFLFLVHNSKTAKTIKSLTRKALLPILT